MTAPNAPRNSGNTRNFATDIPKHTKKRIKRRAWFLTENNPTAETIEKLHNFCLKRSTYFICSKEHEDEEEKTPHIHCYMSFDYGIDLNVLYKEFPRANIKASTIKNKKPARAYITKVIEPLFEWKTFKELLKEKTLDLEYKDVEWKDWQLDIFKIINEYKGDRIINWYVDREGNTGKTYISKYLALTKNCIIADGKKNDIFNQVNTCIESKREPNIIILDIPRYNLDYVNYGVIEKLKDGCLYSGKYEGGICIFPRPIVLIFANELPDYKKMSLDRWNVVEIS